MVGELRPRRFAGRGATELFADARTPSAAFVDACAEKLALNESATAARTRRLLVRLVAFTTTEGVPLDVEAVFDPEVVERFCEIGLANDRSVPTYRAILRRVAAELTTAAPWPPRPKAHPRRALAAPYSEAEIAVLHEDALAQPTARRVRAARAFLALGLGAGLDGRWAARVSAADLLPGTCGLFIRCSKPSPRVVPVRVPYDEELRELAAHAGDEYLIGGRSQSRNRVGNVIAELVIPTGHPALAPARLRSTWLLAHLTAGVRLDVLCRAAGIATTAIFTDLLEFLPEPDAAAAEEMLRGRTQ